MPGIPTFEGYETNQAPRGVPQCLRTEELAESGEELVLTTSKYRSCAPSRFELSTTLLLLETYFTPALRYSDNNSSLVHLQMDSVQGAN